MFVTKTSDREQVYLPSRINVIAGVKSVRVKAVPAFAMRTLFYGANVLNLIFVRGDRSEGGI